MKIGPVLMLAGGGAGVVGAFLPWYKVGEMTINGWDPGDGKISAGCGIAVVLLGLITLMAKGVPKVSLMIVGILAALGLAGVGVYHYIEDKDKIAAIGGTIGIGIYLTAAGGVLAVLGAVLRPKPQG